MRWEGVGDRWSGRAKIVASLIAPGSSVLDFGAGACGLGRLLDPSCAYTPVDLPGVDMNAGLWPEGRWDVAVLSGVLEYADDPGEVLSRLRLLAGEAVITYDHGPAFRSDFTNHLAEEDLRDLALRADWADARIVGWWKMTRTQLQAIWKLT